MVDVITNRQVPAPCCGQDVVVMVRLPTHDPKAFGIQNVVTCPACGDTFKMTVFITTKSEKITLQKPKLELVYG